MKISLSPDVERLIAERVQSGRYKSADEMIRELLNLLLEQEKKAHPSSSNGEGDLAAAFHKIAEDVPETDWEIVPADLSQNVDRYLYGDPKKS